MTRLVILLTLLAFVPLCPAQAAAASPAELKAGDDGRNRHTNSQHAEPTADAEPRPARLTPVQSPADVHKIIDAHKANPASAPLTWLDYEAIGEHIGGGTEAPDQPQWIALAPDLQATQPKAKTAAYLTEALADALPAQPEAVLQALDPAPGKLNSLDAVCGYRYPFSYAIDNADFRKRATTAVAAVTAAALQPKKAQCLQRLGS